MRDELYCRSIAPYLDYESRNLGLTLWRLGCCLTTLSGEMVRVSDLCHTPAPRPAWALVPEGKDIYILFAKPGVPMRKAMESLEQQGIFLGEPDLTLDPPGFAFYVLPSATTETTGGCTVEYEDEQCRIYRLAGKARIDDIGLQPADTTGPHCARPARQEYHYTGPRHSPAEAERLNRYRSELATALLQAGCLIYAVPEDNPDHRVGPLTFGGANFTWRASQQRVAGLVVEPPAGKAVVLQKYDPGQEPEAPTGVGSPLKDAKSIHTALWVVDADKAPDVGVGSGFQVIKAAGEVTLGP